LAWEAETAAGLLPIPQQEYLRHRIAHAIEKLYKQQQIAPSKRLTQQHHEHLLIKQIRRKLNNHHAIVSRADKGNSLVMLYQTDYNDKIQSFLIDNSFSVLPRDPTNKFQNNIRKTISACKMKVPQNSKWKFINLNPSPHISVA
jgi:hypothetical protein